MRIIFLIVEKINLFLFDINEISQLAMNMTVTFLEPCVDLLIKCQTLFYSGS